MAHAKGSAYTQPGWKKCEKCKGLWFSGHGAGLCPAGEGHNVEGNRDYFLWVNGKSTVIEDPSQQPGWKYCPNCAVLWYSGHGFEPSHCPAGPTHAWNPTDGDYNPYLEQGLGEFNWRWCVKCMGMWYAGDNPASHPCPAKGEHSTDNGAGWVSGNYGFDYKEVADHKNRHHS
jgi:hypothetical protein